MLLSLMYVKGRGVPSYFPLSAGTARLDARNQLLDHQGVPSGIDIRKVVETGIVPWINTGIAHR